MEEKQAVKTHRVGSITFGMALIVFGILFLLHLVLPQLSYVTIFHLWPCIFVLLGIEILIGNSRYGEGFVYDKTAIFLIVILALFAMGMGVADYCMEQYSHYLTLYL